MALTLLGSRIGSMHHGAYHEVIVLETQDNKEVFGTVQWLHYYHCAVKRKGVSCTSRTAVA